MRQKRIPCQELVRGDSGHTVVTVAVDTGLKYLMAISIQSSRMCHRGGHAGHPRLSVPSCSSWPRTKRSTELTAPSPSMLDRYHGRLLVCYDCSDPRKSSTIWLNSA